ncbi:MAG: ABC transporter ATP-binding protein [Lachnospiraceae bacterium]|nr:ABC transporter ATP-binding protein [Lachnospiraceae bacterium]
MKNGLKTEQLSVGYEKKVLLSGVELEVRAGSVLTLIGPNGSGKSTILKTLTRQLESLGGRILFLEKDGSAETDAGKENWHDVEEMTGTEIAKRLAMVMTQRPAAELMTCREMVATGRYPYVGMLGILGKEDWQKVDDAMGIMNAEEVADQSFYAISDGQRQRVMLARALCQEPKVLVLDEPTSYLDLRHKLDILESIRRLAKEKGIAVITSLHELDLAMKVSDWIACVDGDRVARQGTPEEIFSGDYVQKLYGVDQECFNPMTGALYLKAGKAQPKIFVIGGGGVGIPTYYKLLREGIPFAAGILFENDLEMDAARACASQVVSAEAFTPIDAKALERARKLIDECESVICPLKTFGPLNEANKALKEYAKNCGKLENVVE